MDIFKSIWEDARIQFGQRNVVAMIIIVNVAVFLLMNFTKLGMFFVNSAKQDEWFDVLVQLLAVPMTFKEILFKPWTIITYMFLHVGFFHLLWNMLIFYWFARILTVYKMDSKVLPLYVYGAWVGVLLSILAFAIEPRLAAGSYALGASAGVSAILIGAATLVPDHPMHLILIGTVRIKYIAAVLFLVDLFALPESGGSGVGHVAHLGGALLGMVFIKQLQRGYDWSKGFNRATNALSSAFSRKPRSRIKVVHSDRKDRRRKGRQTKGGDRQGQVDQILDKINQSGYESLSKDEKDFLFRISKEGDK